MCVWGGRVRLLHSCSTLSLYGIEAVLYDCSARVTVDNASVFISVLFCLFRAAAQISIPFAIRG